MSSARYALVLAGGAGTRFWPASRALRPKQLLPLTGGAPLIIETAERILPVCGDWAHVLVATGRHLADATSAIMPELPRDNLLVEPVPRNTAPCIAWAAARVARIDPDAIVIVLPSDHHVADVAGFRAAVARAVDSAERGVITTIGIRPTHAETGYGYIEIDETASSAPDAAVRVKRFVEKPDRARAEQFFGGGRHLWNAGMFFFRARDMLAAVREHLPALAEGLDAIDRGAADEARAIERVFPTLPAVSIDFGVIEQMRELAVVPAEFGWSDVGSWQSAWELAAKDAQGNAAPADAILIDAANNEVVDLRSAHGKRVIALVGVSDLVVVETEDALLVAPRSRAQDVKLVVDRLKARGDADLV